MDDGVGEGAWVIVRISVDTVSTHQAVEVVFCEIEMVADWPAGFQQLLDWPRSRSLKVFFGSLRKTLQDA